LSNLNREKGFFLCCGSYRDLVIAASAVRRVQSASGSRFGFCAANAATACLGYLQQRLPLSLVANRKHRRILNVPKCGRATILGRGYEQVHCLASYGFQTVNLVKSLVPADIVSRPRQWRIAKQNENCEFACPGLSPPHADVPREKPLITDSASKSGRSRPPIRNPSGHLFAL